MHVETDLCPEAARFARAMLDSGQYPSVDRLLDRALECLAREVDEKEENELKAQLVRESEAVGGARPRPADWREQIEALAAQRASA